MKKAHTEEAFVPRSFYVPHARHPYTGDLVNPVTGEIYKPERRTKQSHKAECDINNIVKQFTQTGQITHMSAKAATGAYSDLPDNLDFQQSLEIVQRGKEAFATLPAKVRDRFGNDPTNFLLFLSDPDNQDEAIRLGLAKDTRPPKPITPPATATPVASKSESSAKPTSSPQT